MLGGLTTGEWWLLIALGFPIGIAIWTILIFGVSAAYLQGSVSILEWKQELMKHKANMAQGILPPPPKDSSNVRY